MFYLLNLTVAQKNSVKITLLNTSSIKSKELLNEKLLKKLDTKSFKNFLTYAILRI